MLKYRKKYVDIICKHSNLLLKLTNTDLDKGSIQLLIYQVLINILKILSKWAMSLRCVPIK